MTVKQISVFVENKAGRLAEITKVLYDNNVDLRALSIAETQDFGVLRLIVDDSYKTACILKEAGYVFSITPVLAVRSSNVTPGLIKRKFGVDAKVVYPDVSTRLALAQLAAQQGEAPNVIVCREGLLPLAESVVGSRRMVRAVRTATVLSYIGALCGVALSYYLTSVGNFAVLTPLSMVVFLLLWLLPTLLIAGLVRHF